MMRLNVIAVGLIVALGLVGCGGNGGFTYCAAAATCAKKGGNTFSETACQNDATTDREQAASKSPSCAGQYDELFTCISGLSCEAVSTLFVSCGSGTCWNTTISTNCGGKIDAFNKCMQ